MKILQHHLELLRYFINIERLSVHMLIQRFKHHNLSFIVFYPFLLRVLQTPDISLIPFRPIR
jgi:hypothetical protein